MSDDDRNVFLAPCDAGDFDRTVRTAVDLDEHPDHPAGLDDGGEVRFLGARADSSEERHFERLAEGDLLLFYADGRFCGVGYVGTTTVDDEGWAGETFWDDDELQLLYTVEEFEEVDVPRAAVNRIFDYGESYTPSGLMRVADGRVNNRPAAIKLALTRVTASAAD